MEVLSVKLQCTLSPEACGQLYEALVCLAKFGDTILLEARQDRLTLMVVNLSKTAHACCVFDSKSFFLKYNFSKEIKKGKNEKENKKEGERFTAQIYNKALQCAFKGRTGDPRGREVPIDCCQLSLEERPDKTECRLIIKMLYKHGMTKVYKLNYEPTQIMHALYPKQETRQSWKIASRVMREYIEFFGPKTEQLALVAQEGKAIFTSFTEKLQNGQEVLKHPVETCITLHIEEFENFHVQEKTNIVISVKDFKALVTHADLLRGQISAYWIEAGQPMLLEYEGPGIKCNFTLMSTGDDVSSTQDTHSFISIRGPTQQSFREAQPFFSTAETTIPHGEKERPEEDELPHEDTDLHASPLARSISDSEPEPDLFTQPSQPQAQMEPQVPSSEIPPASQAEPRNARRSRPQSRQPSLPASRSIADSLDLPSQEDMNVIDSFSFSQARRQPSLAASRSIGDSFSNSPAGRLPSLPLSKSMEESFSQAKRLGVGGATPAASQIVPEIEESLFMPQDDDDGWDEADYDNDSEDHDAFVVQYNPSYGDKTPHATFRDTASQIEARKRDNARLEAASKELDKDPLDPTQRLSGLRGMFD